MVSKPPKMYESLKARYENYMNAVESLGQAVRREGPLDEKTAQIVLLAAAAAIRSEGAVHSHTRRALDAGAAPEEIRHALILLTSTIGFPTVRAALSWADDILKEGGRPPFPNERGRSRRRPRVTGERPR
jgi:4-carboxymuconolactone decarboxylase